MMNMWSSYIVVMLTVAGAHGRTMSSSHVDVVSNSLDSNTPIKYNPESSTTGLLADIRFLYHIYEECKDSDLSTCLKMKLVVAMDRAAKSMTSLNIFEGVSFVKDSNVPTEETAKPVVEKELEATLPRALQDREDSLDKLIADKLYQFFKTHSLQFKLLAIDDIKRSLNSEGEGGRRRKGLNSLYLLSMLLGGTLLPLKFGALALLAGKALIISKLALALAAIIGLKKLVSGGGGHDTSYSVVTVPSHGHGGYKRSVNDGDELAYRAFVPTSAS